MTLRRIVYVHYQRNLTEGSSVHVRAFSEAFSRLCQTKGVDFQVIGPPLGVHLPLPPAGWWARCKEAAARWYLREFKVIITQARRAWREREVLKRLAPDIVLTRYDAETQSIHWACRSLRIPVVTEFNGRDRIELAGTYADFRQFAWLNRLLSNCSTLKLSSGAMAVSRIIADDLRRCNPDGKPVAVNPNGVDAKRFHPRIPGDPRRRSLGIPQDAVVIGYAGSFILWHDPGRLMRTFTHLAGDHPVHLLLVGRRLPEVEALIEPLPPEVQRRIHLTGFVPYDEVPAYLAAMDIAVLPNTQPYCSPLKLFEYMAMGKACVAPDLPPIREVMTHGKEGWLFAPEDDEAFQQALQVLCGDAALRRRLGTQARERVEREFTWDHNAMRAFRVIEEAWDWYHRLRPAGG